MRKTVYKSKAITYWVFVIALILIVSVFPLRLWRRIITFPATGSPLVKSDIITTQDFADNVFTAQYDRIESAEVFVPELITGRYMYVRIYDVGEILVGARYVDLGLFSLPGYVTIPLGYDLNVGDEYRIEILGLMSKLRIAYEPMSGSPQSYLKGARYHWTPVPHMHLHIVLHYNQPVGKGVSLMIMASFAAAAALIALFVRRYFKKHPDRDVPVLVSDAVKPPLYLACAVSFAILFVLNWPLMKFNNRPPEFLFYGFGILLAAAAVFYLCKRLAEDGLFRGRVRLFDLLSVPCVALIVSYACEYMNAVDNPAHAAAEQRMTVCMVILIALQAGSFLRDRYAEQSRRTTANEGGGRAAAKMPARVPSLYGVLTAAVFVCMAAARGGSDWTLKALLLYVPLYVLVSRRGYLPRFYGILYSGIMLNFFLSMGYCLLFRAYQGFVFPRYGFVFHTATVTAEYMSICGALTAARLAQKLSDTRGGALLRIREAWKEAFMCGIVMVYALFTVSRVMVLATGAAVFAVCFLPALSVALVRKKQRIKTFLVRACATGAVIAAVSLYMFPAVFALQRILPAMTGNHQILPGIEQNNTFPTMAGYNKWDSEYYMTIERFSSMLLARFFGMPEGEYNHPELIHFYDEQGRYITDWFGEVVDHDAPADEDGKDGADEETDVIQEDTEETIPEDNDAEPGETDVETLTNEETGPAEEAEPEAEAAPEAEAEPEAEETPEAEAPEAEAEETPEAETAPEAETEPEDLPVDPSVPMYMRRGDGTNELNNDITNGRSKIFRAYIERLEMKGHPEVGIPELNIVHAHNNYLQAMYTYGIPTGVLFGIWIALSVIISAVSYVLRMKRRDPEAGAFLASCAVSVAFAVIGIAEWSFALCNPVSVMFMLLLAPLMSRERRINKQEGDDA